MAEATNPKDVATNGSLMDAALNGNVELVQRLLEAGAEVDKTDEDGRTPLYVAALKGHVEVVQQLLRAGADVNKAKHDGLTPLIIAALEGHMEVVQQLLKAGAGVNMANVNGFTPLFTAAQKGHVEVVQQLLKAGADVDKAKQDGATPLFIAAQEGHVEVMQQLLKAGADVDKAMQTGATPLFIAAQEGHVEVVQQLLKAGAEVDQANQDGATPLFIAAQNGHVEVVQQLLKAGADVDKAMQTGVTPLFMAAQKGHVEVVQQLLKAGADVDKADQDGATPLLKAAQKGHVEVVQQLLKAGADVDKAMQDGVTPLYIAAQNGHVEVVQQLLKAGAEVDRAWQVETSTEEYTDITPLHSVAQSGDLNIVNLLVSAGADTTCTKKIKDKITEQMKEQNPYDVALEGGHNLIAYTIWSASKSRTASKHTGLPTKLSEHRSAVETRQETEKNIIWTIITTVLSEHVGRRWRELGRRLGITEVDLDDVQYRCDRDRGGLKEMTVRSLKLWLDRQMYWPNIFDVWWALQNMQMEDVADLVTKTLSNERNLAGVKDDIKNDDEDRQKNKEELTKEEGDTGTAATPVSKSFIRRFDEVSISSPESPFDAFVSANQRDFPWVDEWVQQLESPPHNLKICVHHRDFKIGVPISHNINWAVANSRKILIVLSQNFLSSNWCKVELRAAIEKALSNDKYCVLPILKSECEIPTELAHLTYLDCTDGTVDVDRLASNLKEEEGKINQFTLGETI